MRAIVLVMDSFGIGGAPDAECFNDTGANTFGHIAQQRAEQDKPLHIPNLTELGLIQAARLSIGEPLSNLQNLKGAFGAACEKSHGKDTPSGHWEMMGLPVLYDWGYFPAEYPSFPDVLLNPIKAKFNLPGFLANHHASGTEIIAKHGEEHIKTGKPIVYTSADSVFQIAAHETHFGLEKLLAICEYARTLVDEYNIGRVIARPFIGEPGNFTRTGNRKDYATPPHSDTLLDKLTAAGGTVISIGKIADIFADRGISQKIKATGNMALFDATLKALSSAKPGSLIFTNFVDFDSSYGHRRDVEGYAKAIEAFDARLPELIQQLQLDDMVIITADHGCDPTWPGSDHTRENIPVLAFGPNIEAVSLGVRQSFADIGQTLAAFFQLTPLKNGESFLKNIELSELR